MAHVAKYKTHAAASMLAHYRRDREGTMERENIDPERSCYNYAIEWDEAGHARCEPGAGARGDYETVKARWAEAERKAGRKIRKDAIGLGDVVVTLPEDVEADGADERRFFVAATSAVARLVGRDNVVGAFVHKDEPGARPHAHISFVPITPDGKLSYKQVMSRPKYKRLHPEIERQCQRVMGWVPAVRLDEDEKGRRELSSLNNREYRQAMDALRESQREAEAARRQAERCRQEATESLLRAEQARARAEEAERAKEAAERTQRAAEGVLRDTRAQAEAERERLERLRRRVEAAEQERRALRERRSQTRSAAAMAGRDVAAREAELAEVGARQRRARKDGQALLARLTRELGNAPKEMWSRIREIAYGMGLRGKWRNLVLERRARERREAERWREVERGRTMGYGRSM